MNFLARCATRFFPAERVNYCARVRAGRSKNTCRRMAETRAPSQTPHSALRVCVCACLGALDGVTSPRRASCAARAGGQDACGDRGAWRSPRPRCAAGRPFARRRAPRCASRGRMVVVRADAAAGDITSDAAVPSECGDQGDSAQACQGASAMPWGLRVCRLALTRRGGVAARVRVPAAQAVGGARGVGAVPAAALLRGPSRRALARNICAACTGRGGRPPCGGGGGGATSN